jgi:hypothetical protein
MRKFGNMTVESVDVGSVEVGSVEVNEKRTNTAQCVYVCRDGDHFFAESRVDFFHDKKWMRFLS